MARKNRLLPAYGSTTVTGGKDYFRTRIRDDDGRRITLYGRTREELYEKAVDAQRQIQSLPTTLF